MGGLADHTPHGYCALCEGPCSSGIDQPPHDYPFVHPVDRAPDPNDAKPQKARRGKRKKRPQEDRMKRLDEDR